ncbi:MAG: aldo/keto reductase [Hyphomicrobium sp.]
MIPQVQLAGSSLKTSRLAFGTSRLHYASAHLRPELLAAAADLGITHLDTAPLYGDGLAEREVGRFVRGQRSRFVIATKYGNPPDALIEAVPALATPVRGVRAIGRRLGLVQAKRPPMTATGLRESVENSLRRLGAGWIDILFLHEPSLERIAAPGALLEELISLRQRGLITHFGLAGKWPGIESLGPFARDAGEIVQTGESEWPETSPPAITYGAISQASQHYFAPAVDATSAAQRLRAALDRRPNGVVIVSTSKPGNLRLLAEAAASKP